MGAIQDRLWEKAVKHRFPLTAAFELLPNCNLQCKMCYVRKSMAEVNEMGGLLTTDEWLSYARQARDLGMLYPLLTGGEPFLRDDLQELLTKMQEMGLQVSINSNGTLIGEDTAKWLSRHKPTRINITIYGASEESYQKLCGDGGAYERLLRAVSLLKQYDVPVKFNTSITPYNIEDLGAMIAYAKSVGSPIQVATYMFPPVRRDAGMIGQNDRLSPEKAAYAKVKADFLQNEPSWFLGQAYYYSRFLMPTDEMLAKQAAGEGHEMTCRAGRCSFWLDWQGNVGNCGMYSSVKYNLKEMTLREAWEKTVMEIEQVRYSPVCTNCPNFKICHSCIAMVHNECGDVNGRPDYLCRYNAAAAHYYRVFAEKISSAAPEEIRLQSVPNAECDFEQDIF